MIVAWDGALGFMITNTGYNPSQPDGPPRTEYLSIRKQAAAILGRDVSNPSSYANIYVGIINDITYQSVVLSLISCGYAQIYPNGIVGSPDADNLCDISSPGSIPIFNKISGKAVVYLNKDALSIPGADAYRCELSGVTTPYRIDTKTIVEFYVSIPDGQAEGSPVSWVLEDGAGNYIPTTTLSAPGTTTLYGTSDTGAALCGSTTLATAKIAIMFIVAGTYRLTARTAQHGSYTWDIHVQHFYAPTGNDKYFTDDKGPDHPWPITWVSAANKTATIKFVSGGVYHTVTVPTWTAARDSPRTTIDDLGYILGNTTQLANDVNDKVNLMLPYLRTMYLDLYGSSAPF